MLQRQIVVKALDKQMDIEDPALTIYLITTLYSIDWMFIPVHVTVDRTVPMQAY